MSEGASSRPVRKQRMGTTPSPEAPAEAEVTPPRRTRMGQSAGTSETHAPPARTRMGAAGAGAGSTRPAAANPGSPAGSRMGGRPVGAAPAPSSSASASVPAAAPATPTTSSVSGVARKSWRWKRRILWVVGLLVVAAVVLLARWLRELPAVAGFVEEFPGTPTMPSATPEGVPGWMGWQHFFNMFFMVLIVRTGLQVRNEKRAPGYFTPRKNSFFSPKGSTPKKVSLSQWIHQALDVFWMLNGLIFIVLLFATNQWLRIVPTHLDIIPNALSAGLQYVSLDWPYENGWVHYNALQMLVYTVTVFIAAPLAVISGVRFSTWWPDTNARLSRIYPVEVARALHFPVALYFVAFTVVHVMLVFLTGALRNLNHMYTSRDIGDWLGLLVFLGSVLVIAAAWTLTKPLFMRPVAQRFGTLTK